MTQSIPALLRMYGLRPKKGLGQNFLVDPVALGRVVDAAELLPDDTVVEVGAGLGTLTRPLAEQAGRVLAVELDEHLVEVLEHQLGDLPNVQIVQGDVLNIADLGLPSHGYKVVGNLPYYITSAVLRHFLEMESGPRLMVVTVQREVAERITSKPPRMSLLAISVQFFGHARIVARIPAGSFYPAPKVDSAVVRIDVGERPTVSLAEGLDEAALFCVARAGFGQKRKMLLNSLSAGLGMRPKLVEEALLAAGVAPRRRAETLTLQEWADTTAALSARTL